MSIDYGMLHEAVADYHRSRAAIRLHAKKLASLLPGNMREIGEDYEGAKLLRKIKRELRDFDMTTGRWK